MLFTILAVFFASILTPFFYNKYEKTVRVLLSLLVGGIVVYFATYLVPVSKGETFQLVYPWLDSLDIQLSFYLDGLSLFFALLVTVFGLLVLLYSFQYMEHDSQRNRFFCYFLFFMGSMLGVVLSANLISLFVFWELTSLSSFLLIGFKNEKKESRRAARQALLVTAGGGLTLMSGFILLEIITKSGFDVISIIKNEELVVGSSLQTAAIILIVIGAMTKSAQFPFHFWLPNAMAAPTPVSAYLHSATMVKAGVYLIFRLNPVFEDIALWHHLLGIAGAVTMTWGAFKALQEDDLKKILAYTTISALGIFFMMTGVGGEAALNALMVYVLAHALYKGGLFLTAGSIDHQAGTRNISQLSDLSKKMPVTSLALVLCFASMAGILPFLGFVGKESLYEVLLHAENPLGIIYLVLLFSASVFFIAVSIDVVYSAVVSTGKLKDKSVKEAKTLMIVGPVIMATTGLLVGILPGMTIEPLLQWTAASSFQSEPTMKLKLWHGFNWVLLLSVITILCGVALYFSLKFIRRFEKPRWLSADFIYDKSLEGIKFSSKSITSQIQNGLLRDYIAIVIFVFSVLVIYTLADGDLLVFPTAETLAKDLQIYELVIFALTLLAVVFLFKTRSRLIVTATFGIIGYGIALAYTLFSAPDVAITQFLAETLTLMLLILILHKLPHYTLKKFIAHKKYLPISILFGVVMAVVSFVMLGLEKDSDLKRFFLEKSVSEGKGQNAVNVILVDFRALDTLGEITVLTITMIGIIALLKVKPGKQKS